MEEPWPEVAVAVCILSWLVVVAGKLVSRRSCSGYVGGGNGRRKRRGKDAGMVNC